MKPLHYAVFLAVVAPGLATGFLLVPGESELGLIYLKDKQYSAARAIYEKRVAAGDLSLNVVMPLTELYLQYGEVNRAISLLERFARSSPNRFELGQRVGQFHQYAQRPDDYLKKLEEINQLRASEESLRELASLYRYTNHSKKLVAALRALVSGYPRHAPDFLELANLEAKEGEVAAAARTLEEFERRHSGAVTEETVEMLISLLLDTRQGGRALERAARWLAAHRDPEVAARFAGLFHFKGDAARGLELLAPFVSAADSHPVLLVQLVRLEMATGSGDAAFERLEALRSRGRLPEEAAEPYVELALNREKLAEAIETAQSAGLRQLPDWLLANLAGAAFAGGRADFARKMVVTLGESFLGSQPVLAAQLAHERGDEAARERWLRNAVKSPGLDPSDRATLAGFLLELGRPEEALAEVRRVRLSRAEPDLAAGVADVYLRLKMPAEGLARLEELRGRGAAAAIEPSWALLAASAGRAREAERWLKTTAAALTESFLTDLFFVASDADARTLSLACARLLHGRRPDEESLVRLTNALVAAGLQAEALPHLRILLARGPAGGEIEAAYVEALSAAIRAGGGAALRTELRAYWSRKLVEPGREDRERLEWIHGLIDLEAYDAALAPLEALARNQEDLFYLYLDTALKAGRKDKAVSFLESELERAGLSAARRDARLHALIEHAGAARALPHMRRLADAGEKEWVYAYEDALAKLGQDGELAGFWRRRAARAGLGAEEKREIAFKLLDAGHKGDAERVFRELAGRAKPDEPVVSDLLFLWGAKPAKEALAWLERRAADSRGGERAAWLRHLYEAGAAERTADIACASLPAAGQGGALLEVCLDALNQTGRHERLGSLVEREAAALADTAQLRKLARLALGAGQPRAAETAFRKLAAAAPEDAEALRWMGAIAYQQARYAEARELLARLLQAAPGDAETNYYAGELALRDGRRAEATRHFGRALRLIEQEPAPAAGLRAVLLFRTGERERGLAEMRALVAGSPADGNLRADYAGLLMEESALAAAWQVLAAAPAESQGRARVLAQLAAAEQQIGRRRKADGLMEQALRSDPGNRHLEEAAAGLRRELVPKSVFETDWRQISQAWREHRTRLGGEARLGPGLRLGAEYELNRVAGTARDPFHALRDRGRVWLEAEQEAGMRLAGTLYWSPAGPGAGVTLRHPSARGATTISADYRRPYWEYFETLIGGGVRDRVEIRREAGFGRRIEARIAGAANRYGLEGMPNAAATAGFEAGAGVRLFRFPYVAAEYMVDAEYRLQAKALLPLPSREVHSTSLASSRDLTRNLHLAGAAGLARDRFGGQAPFFGLRLGYLGRGHVAAHVEFERRLYRLDTARTEMRVGANVTWRF